MQTTYSLLVASFFLLITSSSTKAIEFQNFSNQVVLTPIAGNNYFYADKRITVKLTNRIIIKASVTVTKEHLKKIDQRVTSVQELYRLSNGIYYVVTVNEKDNLSEIIDSYEASSCVYLTQPDLLQLREETGHPANQQRQTNYIEKLNISSLWEKTMGENVKIAIIDDGFDLNHEDLQGLNLLFGYDIDTKTLDPSPKSPIDTHGTQVAGVIFAQHNNIGTDGIAPKAELIAIRHTNTWTSKTILSFYLAKITGADIVNCSWESLVLIQPLADIIQDLTTSGRQGKGILLVFSAGNHGLILRENSREATLPLVIAVGSMHSPGRRLAFSNYGENVDIFTYGENILTPTRGSEKYAFFTGTSASATIVSGVAALLLSQNSELELVPLQQQLKHFFGAQHNGGKKQSKEQRPSTQKRE